MKSIYQFVPFLLLFISVANGQNKLKINHGCSFVGDKYQSEVLTWNSDLDARDALERVMKYTGLPQNFTIMAADVSTAQAGIVGTTRYILYNPSFMKKIRDYTNNDWTAISILAHEIGHHLSGHTLDNEGSRPAKELEADLFSGFVLYKMGASLNDAILAIQTVGNEEQTSTHPSRSARIGAITRGWMSSKSTSTQTETVKQSKPSVHSPSELDRESLVKRYSRFSKAGAEFYNQGNYSAALESFRNCLITFDMLVTKGYVSQILDTTITLYAGICAEKANDILGAANYYAQIADRKVKGEGFIEIYKWLADYYRTSGNVLKSLKYLTIGKEVYPNDPFWVGFDLDLAREQGNKDELFRKYEQVIRDNPYDHRFIFNYGLESYQAAYHEDIAKRPYNSKELIARAIELMKRTLKIKPDYANAYMVLGQIYYNEGIDINNENKTIRPQAGYNLTTDQLQKKRKLKIRANSEV